MRLLDSAAIPRTEAGLNRLSQRVWDLDAFVKARNETAHPKGASKFSSAEWVDLYRLSLKWLELVMLHRIEYDGEFTDRFSYATSRVPWFVDPARQRQSVRP